MAKNQTSFRPGQSGNPKGRPPKERELTNLLVQVGNKTIFVDGKRVVQKRFLAGAVWDLLTAGRTTLADGKLLEVDASEWQSLVKFLYGHVDGPPKLEIAHEGDVTTTVKVLRGVKMEDL